MQVFSLSKYVEIINGSVVLATNAKYCENILPRAKGLMFSKPLKQGSAIVLVSPKEGILETTIHMMFVFFPLDIVWLNKNKEVVDFCKGVKPFTFVAPKKAAKYVLELPCGVCENLKLGDKITLQFNE